MDSQWLYYSAEWVPALFIMVLVVILEERPGLTRKILEGVCSNRLKDRDSCVAILKQKALLEFGILSFTLAIARELAQGHNYMALLGLAGMSIFAGFGYVYLTLHQVRQFNWVREPLPCSVYVLSLIAITTTISLFGVSIESRAIEVAWFFSQPGRPVLFFLVLAVILFLVVFYLQMKKAERDSQHERPLG